MKKLKVYKADGTFYEVNDPGVVVSVPEPNPKQETTVWDELDAAYQEGVNSAYDS